MPVVTVNGREWEIDTGIEVPVSRLDALSLRMANAVIDGTYANAREAAKANVVEYAAHETSNEVRLNTQIGNFTRKIIKTLADLEHDKFGSPIPSS